MVVREEQLSSNYSLFPSGCHRPSVHYIIRVSQGSCIRVTQVEVSSVYLAWPGLPTHSCTHIKHRDKLSQIILYQIYASDKRVADITTIVIVIMIRDSDCIVTVF